MPIELRIQRGARAGQTATFEKLVIAIGRDPMSDLRFDVKQDLDVSTRHGEIRGTDGRWAIHDLQSTNGTFVNGKRVPQGGSQILQTGDTVGFGPHGPTMTVHIAGQPAATRVSSSHSPQPEKKRTGTGERVAIAVKQQTRGLRIAIVATIVVLGGVAAGTLWMSKRDAARAGAEIAALIKANEEAQKQFQAQLKKGLNDTALTNSLQHRFDSVVAAARAARGQNATEAAQLALRSVGDLQRKVSEMDLPAVIAANNPAVVLINAEIGPTRQEATGFCILSSGLIVTNQHVVVDSATGAKATRIHVKFAKSRQWQPAHIVKVSGDKDIDVALIQVESPDRAFSVVTLAKSVDTPIGGPIVIIGFPDGTSAAMDGTGNDAGAITTPTVGIVSKALSNILTLDAFATHGSSGSPVFDAHSHVIGVVWGGIANGIVYAVPAERIVELVKSVK